MDLEISQIRGVKPLYGIKENNARYLDEVNNQLRNTDHVKYSFISFSDIHGSIRAKLIPVDNLASVSEQGAGFAGYAVGDLGHGPSDPDILCVPDVRSYTVLPWKKDVAWFAGVLTEDGSPWPYCSRTILLRVLEKAKSMGFTMMTGIEPEFFLLKRDANGKMVPYDDKDTDAKPCYQQQALMRNIDFLSALMDNMNNLGWGVYQIDHEDANGQFEINWRYADALTSADRHNFFKFMVRSLAEERGLMATFMPKPFANLTGNGSHMHLSLWDEQQSTNLFFDPLDPRGHRLSKLAYHFIGGLLLHARATAAVIAPTVNSYKRFSARTTTSGATWAPNYITYGGNNRTQMIRIPGHGRIEYRAVDGAANPYMAAAVVLAAGLDGIEKEIDPGDPFDSNMYTLSSGDIGHRDIKVLPANLQEAIQALEADDVIKEALGSDFARTYVERKLKEWADYHAYVSEWEVDRYLTGY